MIGEHLKDVRKSLGLTQAQMAGKAINRSFYSRIENGQSTVTVKDLMKIVYSHNLSMIGFLQEFGETEEKMAIYQDKISNAYLNKNVEMLKVLYMNQEFEDRRINQLLEYLIAKIEGHADNFEIKKLGWNFLKKGELNEETLWLIFHVMDSYKFGDLEGLVKAIFNKYHSKDVNNRTIHLIARIAVKYLNICFKEKVSYEIKKTIEFLQQLPDSTEFGLYKIAGIYYEKRFNHEEGELKQIISLFDKENIRNYLEMN